MKHSDQKSELTYMQAVVWIAFNDEPADKDVNSVKGYISTSLVADLFYRSNLEVAKDIVAERKRNN